MPHSTPTKFTYIVSAFTSVTPQMSQENPKKRGTWKKVINNNGLENACIAGQGQKVTFICKDDKNAVAEPPVSEDLKFETILRLLESGIDVDQSIHNSASKGLVILGQGQETQLNVDINALKILKNVQTHQAQQETDDQLELQEGMMNLL